MKGKQQSASAQSGQSEQDLVIPLPQNHLLIIHHRYEVIHILNDILISIWFFIGTIFFFYPGLKESGTWLFLIGSGQMFIRPVIRIAGKIHLKQIGGRSGDTSSMMQ